MDYKEIKNETPHETAPHLESIRDFKDQQVLESSLYEEALEMLVKEWNETKNFNAFIFAQFITQYPTFLLMEFFRKPKQKDLLSNKLKVPLWNRLCNKMTCYNKHSSGKKKKQQKLLLQALKELDYPYSPTVLLLKVLVKCIPNQDIRSLPHGSGVLTKTVELTISRKISLFLKLLTEPVYRGKKPFKKKLNTLIEEVLTSNPKSFLLRKKKEYETSAQKANLS